MDTNYSEENGTRKKLELSDAPGFTIPVFSKKAISIIYPLVSNCIELLPLIFSENEYYGINVLSVLDAIDYEKSTYRTFRDGKRIMAFQKYSFIEKEIVSIHIFKITDEKTRNAFVSDEFKELVEKSGLTGFKFKLVWDSESE